ncbi:WD40 repeat-like protein [Neolentinus lepideus HHB14362 ss-1]|uniref:WD40 repeat-like protein n=1 Tax=Neolentinus lepideus HHB14362 ss-1 TaxID=1314782 RepID=A0A165RNQ1_9AGAM|nr:WD40 repeat-like protein [Neolentinus lepideus HHB14362 ss-1]
MDKSIMGDRMKPFMPPTVTSILGLKEPLRIRPHGSTQKPHVVLRRVEESEELGDDGNKRKIVYYSLFASKRIEVKPGKEILLAIPDSTFKDQPLIFGGELSDIETSFARKDDRESLREDVAFEQNEPINQVMPPKMRKAWKARSLGGSGAVPAAVPIPAPIEPVPSASPRVSVAVQAQPEYVAAGMQARPLCSTQYVQASVTTENASCQISPSYTSSSIQAEFQLATSHVQPPEVVERKNNEDTQKLTTVDTPIVKSLELNRQSPVATPSSDADAVTIRQRSLSPMELDSPSSTPPQSPTAAVSARTTSYDSLASSRAGSVPRQATSTPSFIPDSCVPNLSPTLALPASSVAPNNMPTDDIKRVAIHTSAKPTQPMKEPFAVPGSHTASNSHYLQPLAVSLGKRGRSPPTGPRSRACSDIGTTQEQARSAAASVPQPTAGHSRGIPVAPAAFLTLPANAPPTAPAALLSATSSTGMSVPQVSQSTFKPIGTVRTTTPSSSEWKPASFAPIAPTPGPLGNPLGIRPSVPPVVRNGVNTRTPMPPKAPAALTTSKKPVVVGAAWPPVRHQVQTSSPTPSPSSVTTSVGSIKQATPPDNVPLPLPTPPHSVYRNAASHSSLSPSQLSGIVSYRSPSPEVGSPEVANRPLTLLKQSMSTTPVRFVSNGLHSSAAPSSLSSPVGMKGETRKAHPSQVKVEEQSSLPQKPSQTNLSDVLTGAGPTSAEFDHPPGLGLINKPSKDSLAPPKVAPPPTPVPVKHPLPPKPMAAAGPAPHKYEPNRPVIGVKRSAAMATRDPETTRRRSFKWPVLEPIHTVRVKGDDNVGIRGITFNSNGSQFAVNCQDCTVRIWNNHSHTEVATLKHSAPVVSVAWMDDGAGVVSLGDNGIVSKWVRLDQNKWHWAKILDSGRADEDPTCLAYMRDRIAVAFPRKGVKVWLWVKGTWQLQRSILRQNVSAIRFVDDGDALLGGTTDGVLWYCQVPSGTLRAYAFFKTKVYHLDVNALGTHALVAHNGGRCHLVGIKEDGHRGKVERAYMLKDNAVLNAATYDFGAVFANGDQSVLWGGLDGCVLVWDRSSTEVVWGLDHGDEVVQAVASFGSSVGSSEHHLVTGTKHGQLTWWPHSPANLDTPRKRMKSADLD